MQENPRSHQTPPAEGGAAPQEKAPAPQGSSREKLPVRSPRQGVKRSAKRSAEASFSDASTRVSEPVPPPPKEEEPQKEAEPAKKKKKPETKDRGGITLSIVKALIYIAFILAVSAFIGFTGIRWGNDIFAFVKEEKTASITVSEFSTVAEIADLLQSQGLIGEPEAFKFYIGYKYRNKTLQIVPGTYELSSTMNYDQMINAIRKKAPERQIVTVTIPEGYTIDQIIDLLVNEYKIGGTREDYVKAINEYDYQYDFIKKLSELELSKDRKYRLEGYLFPAKYDVYTDLSAVGIIDYFLRAFEQRFDQSYYERLIELNMNLDQAITMASLVQAEGKFDSDYYLISSVFHNRLNSASHKKLESDATIQYFLPERKEELSQADLNIDNPYNTYVYEGLMPGAICNPGLEAIHAALYPEETKYLYFVADVDGHSLFAETNAQHEKNKATVKQNKEAAAAD